MNDLFEECCWCKPAVAALLDLRAALCTTGVRLVGTTPEEPARPMTWVHPEEIRCAACKGTRLILTGAGRRLVALLRLQLAEPDPPPVPF